MRAFLWAVPVFLSVALVTSSAEEKMADKGATGKVIFEESFDKGMENWVSEGPHTVEVKDGRLHVKTVQGGNLGQFVWCRKELPDNFRVEFDVTPVSDSGFFLIFFCVQGVKGEDILGPELFDNYFNWKTWKDYQDWDKYTSPPKRKHDSRIRGYHTSYRRNELANCNLRKNPGLNLVKSSDLKSLLPRDKTAHVVLAKEGAHVTLVVNGETFMDWTDDGKIDGPFYNGGRFGFRQVYDADGHYDNVKIYDLGVGK